MAKRPTRKKKLAALSPEVREGAEMRLRALFNAWALLTSGDERYFQRVLRGDDVAAFTLEQLLGAALLHKPQGLVVLGQFVGATVVSPIHGEVATWLIDEAALATIEIKVITASQGYGPAIDACGLTEAVEHLLRLMVKQEKLPSPKPAHEYPRPQLRRVQ